MRATRDTDPSGSLARRAEDAVVAYRQGRTGPLEDLVREASGMLWHVVRSQGVPRAEAEDVVQGVWLTLIRSVDAIRDPATTLQWLLVTARRAAWKATQAARRRDATTTPLPDPAERPAAELRDPGPDPVEPLLDAERDRVLWRAFQGLPERCRTLLRFVAAADRPDYRSISEATGMPVTSVGVTRGRCLAKLRVLLAAEGWVGA